MTVQKEHKPIGILGGTFNPIHHGHLRLALELYERLDCEKILLIPSARPPHREQPTVSCQHRLEMVQSAIFGVTGLSVDDRELRRKGPSYMVDTVSSLRDDYPQNPLYLILGLDAFMGLSHWYQWKRLVHLTHLLVIVRRPESVLSPKHPMSEFLNNAPNIRIEDIPGLNISATHIRCLIAAGKNPRYLLPNAVLNIINTYQLYHDNII